MSWDVIVIGAGAAGLLAASRAAERGRRVLLLEKNRKAGVKILMSGGTRCNITHAVDKWGIIEAFGSQGAFLHSPLAALGPSDLVELIESEGVNTKVEETGKIFPASDRASDVLWGLQKRLRRSGAELSTGESVLDVEQTEGGFAVHTDRRRFDAGKIVVTTGGQSYPGCGTTGDGYGWARKLGHSIVPPRPALVPVTTDAPWVKQLRGITIPDVCVRVERRSNSPQDAPTNKTIPLAERRGSFLFTHFGLSGPSVLDISRAITGDAEARSLDIVCDFLPDISADELAGRLRSDCASAGMKQIITVIGHWTARRLAEVLLATAGLSVEQHAAELSKSERARIVDAFKRTHIPVAGTRGFKKAEVTAGGVALDDVDSRTMQSKIAAGLYLAGEILDLDGPIGGYNFQAAFSTGWLAGDRV